MATSCYCYYNYSNHYNCPCHFRTDRVGVTRVFLHQLSCIKISGPGFGSGSGSGSGSGCEFVLPKKKSKWLGRRRFKLVASAELSHSLSVNIGLDSKAIMGDSKTHTWQEAFKVLGIKYNRDGTLNREIQIPMVDATPTADPKQPNQLALSTDIPLSPYNKAYIRLYIPSNTPTGTKLPLIIYLHGGDFVLFSASTVIFHEFCNNIAGQFPAVVASVEYRLAPENRLPAAYDDALNAILWAKDQARGVGGRDPWLEYADFSRVFIMGSSAGANIAYHVALRALDFDLGPLKIIGLLMNQPFFGGLQRTQSELRLEEDKYVPLYVCDVLWSLALPQGANRDHEFCNPINGGSYLGRVERLPRCFVKSDEGDPMVDRAMQLVHLLQSYGVPVIYQFNRGGYHGMELLDKAAAKNLYDDMKEFVYSTKPNQNGCGHGPNRCF